MVTTHSRESMSAFEHTRPASVWAAESHRVPQPTLVDDSSCDLLVVGGGLGGLWAALRASERHPEWTIQLIEAERVAGAASGRNGGFVSYSLTHGLANGYSRWPEELEQLERLGMRNLEEYEADVERYGIDCGFVRSGKILLATEPYQVSGVASAAALSARFGRTLTPLTSTEVRDRVNSPTYLGGLWDPTGTALVDPVRLAEGLLSVLLKRGVHVAENTPGLDLRRRGDRVAVTTPYAQIHARRVVLATSAFTPLLARLRLAAIPVYDYAIATEPLSPATLDSIGWRDREGLTDSANQFHYYRLTDDNRLLWGGYDAIYHYGSKVSPELDQRPETFRTLADHLLTTFPQLDGVKIGHSWGGVVDSSTRFNAFYGTALRGQVAYVLGHTGLGVGSSRFSADVLVDLLDQSETERTRLKMVRSQPVPFPPEPVRSVGVNLTRRSMAKADRQEGRRDLWLKSMDALGIGFDS
ncbi:NAD(P)/FAD-dependent oxidoreductase [Mycetocola sp.]|uniref:NAD(P)/FAD-dependent oxidoreductase n=1 Tax=Mycetocola sp. TaxID=1871042 RepID=UPI0039897B0E